MIKIIYKGGYGNKLFQYAFAKLHACFNCIQICNLSLSKLPFTINDIEVLEWNDKDVIYAGKNFGIVVNNFNNIDLDIENSNKTV